MGSNGRGAFKIFIYKRRALLWRGIKGVGRCGKHEYSGCDRYGAWRVFKADCIITDHMIDAFVNPQKIGTYKLKYIYEIADETWVDNVRLKVN